MTVETLLDDGQLCAGEDWLQNSGEINSLQIKIKFLENKAALIAKDLKNINREITLLKEKTIFSNRINVVS